MKLTKIVAFALALFFISNTYAADGSSGCGAGWFILKKNSLISSLSRSFTNIMLSNTFGMTTGTSNCAKHSIVKNDFKAIHFTENSFEQLQTEMALGEGAYLLTLADLMGCSGASTRFQNVVKSNYEGIFPASDTKPDQMLKNVKGQVLGDKILSKNCAIM